jgi:hypothetical protein
MALFRVFWVCCLLENRGHIALNIADQEQGIVLAGASISAGELQARGAG